MLAPEVEDRLIDFFATDSVERLGANSRDEARVMALWFLLGLRAAQIHPEWAMAILHQDSFEAGWIDSAGNPISDDLLEHYRADPDRIVAAVPIALSAEPDDG